MKNIKKIPFHYIIRIRYNFFCIVHELSSFVKDSQYVHIILYIDLVVCRSTSMSKSNWFQSSKIEISNRNNSIILWNALPLPSSESSCQNVNELWKENNELLDYITKYVYYIHELWKCMIYFFYNFDIHLNKWNIWKWWKYRTTITSLLLISPCHNDNLNYYSI